MPRDPRRGSRERELREAYFARVRPVLGDGLARSMISVEGAALPLVARVLELLAGCRLGRISVVGSAARAGWPMPLLFSLAAPAGPAPPSRSTDGARGSSLAALRRYLRFKNPFAPPRIGPGAVSAELHLDAVRLAPGATPAIHWDARARRATLLVPAHDLFAHAELSYALARDARDALLGRHPLPDGMRYLGESGWPFAERATPPAAPPTTTPDRLDGKHLVVLGCGSVGSETLRLLARSGARLTLVDGGRVSIFNPHRQWFGASEVGALKVDALARRLDPARTRAVALELTPATLPALVERLAREPPDAVLLATGTAAGLLAAAELWRRRIPHLAACAYPRARFFELAVVDPTGRTPCLACLRGGLDRGPEAELPIDDELGRFLYEELAPAERERRWQELVAEPATPIETGRIADLAARCLVELARPASERSLWFRRLGAEGTNCLLGGNVVLRGEDGTLAYGIRYPGQVVRLGLADLRARGARSRCEVCGRAFRGATRAATPEADAGAVERALLAR